MTQVNLGAGQWVVPHEGAGLRSLAECGSPALGTCCDLRPSKWGAWEPLLWEAVEDKAVLSG